MSFRKISFAFIIIIAITTTTAFSQLDNKILSNELTINAKDSNKLFFSFNSLNFLRKTEYFGDIEFGKTMFGYSLNPKLVYYPNQYVRIDVGGLFRKDYGNDEFKIVAPTFSVKVSKNGFSGIFGNYEGGMTHQYIEPLFNIDYAITKPLENGLQLKISKKKVWSDTWIDWQKMIYQNSPFKEEISAGTSNVFTVLGADKKFRISIPLQAIIHHFGGQIDTTHSTPLSTTINTASGLRFSYFFSDGSFFKELRSDNYYVTYYEESPKKRQVYAGGDAIYLNLLLKTKHIGVMASYWSGDQYIAPNGTQIFESINRNEPTRSTYKEPQRQLLFLRLLYEKQLYKGLNMDVRFEPFYEFNRKAVDFSYSIYLKYNLNVKLATIKPNFND
jgi:hypothetical protein